MICSKKSRPAPLAVTSAGKAVRACDSCVCRLARWYCTADDAFLCQNCDSSVHSANPLARRHHRVRLQTDSVLSNKLAPAWHHGFKRKARTPRTPKGKSGGEGGAVPPFVPEIETSGEEASNEEEQLLYRVPIFDPALAEFCTPPLPDDTSSDVKPTVHHQLPAETAKADAEQGANSNGNDQFFAGFLQSDAELAEFAADMENLLGRGDDSFSMEELGLIVTPTCCPRESGVKEETDNDIPLPDDTSTDVKLHHEIDLSRETLEINFDCRSEDNDQEDTVKEECQEGKGIGLSLDYEAIAMEWLAHGSSTPWLNGERPQLGPNDYLLDYMGHWGGGGDQVHGLVPDETGAGHFDERREARVSRYREKRRTRLFSKKIRYEVRKLNAEKRPRMKGRFVKRVPANNLPQIFKS